MSSPISEAYHGDNMDFMRQFPDKFFNLAVVDPPYGIKESRRKAYHSKAITTYLPKKWDNTLPTNEYFEELFRVSKNQIIWGGNYFVLPPSPKWVVWDKLQPEGIDQSMHELAWTSFQKKQSMIFRRSPSADKNCISNNIDLARLNTRIHPTQKPVALYRWILENYAKPGDKILDTHMGSQSSRIAAYKMGFDYWGAELDADYFRDGCARFQKEIAEPLFQVENPGIKQTSILDYQNREI